MRAARELRNLERAIHKGAGPARCIQIVPFVFILRDIGMNPHVNVVFYISR